MRGSQGGNRVGWRSPRVFVARRSEEGHGARGVRRGDHGGFGHAFGARKRRNRRFSMFFPPFFCRKSRRSAESVRCCTLAGRSLLGASRGLLVQGSRLRATERISVAQSDRATGRNVTALHPRPDVRHDV